MSNKRHKGDNYCPYLLVADSAGSGPPRGSTQHRCRARGTERDISVYQQTATCLASDFTTCPAYPDPETEGAGWAASPASSSPTIADMAVLCLMAGLVLFSIFAIAPRQPQTPLAQYGQPAETQVPLAAEPSGGRDEAAAMVSSPTATASPVPSPSPAPATAAPAPAPTPQPTRAPVRTPGPTPTTASSKTYVAKQGDTLFSIARVYNVSVDALAKANGLSDPQKLRAGQKIRIP